MHGVFTFPLPQRRRTDVARDSDVVGREELTGFERFVRRVFLAHRAKWGKAVLVVVGILTPFAAIEPNPYFQAAIQALTGLGGVLWGAGSSKPDVYHRVKNEVLEQRGKM